MEIWLGGWRKFFYGLFLIWMLFLLAASSVVAASETASFSSIDHHRSIGTNVDIDTYTVQVGDSLWKIAVRYEIGLREIITANPQIEQPQWIYPGDKVRVPLLTTTKGIEQEAVRLVNAERQAAGLPPLITDWQLTRVARIKSEEMRDRGYFAHQSPTYGTPFEMMSKFGLSFRGAGENIAAGQATAKQVVASWMNSPGHRQNILNKSFTHVGIGYASGGKNSHYWTQMFLTK